MQREKQRAPSDASLNGWNSYRTNNTTIRWSCKYRLINVSECKSSLKRSLENHQNPTAQATAQATARATARATKWPINGVIHYTTDQKNDLFDIVISGYQWWCKSSLIATDSLTTFARFFLPPEIWVVSDKNHIIENSFFSVSLYFYFPCHT